jgi:hypothetical protein
MSLKLLFFDRFFFIIYQIIVRKREKINGIVLNKYDYINPLNKKKYMICALYAKTGGLSNLIGSRYNSDEKSESLELTILNFNLKLTDVTSSELTCDSKGILYRDAETILIKNLSYSN